MFYMPVANEKINRIVWLFSFFFLKESIELVCNINAIFLRRQNGYYYKKF